MGVTCPKSAVFRVSSTMLKRSALTTLSRARRENGHTMIELLVVLVIIGILMTFAIIYMTGAKRAVNTNRAVTAAQPYVDAIIRFKATHGGRVPIATSTEWPSLAPDPSPTAVLPSGGIGRGPRSTVTSKYLMRKVPFDIQDGTIEMGIGTPAPTSDALAYLRVRILCFTPACKKYQIDVYRRPQGKPWDPDPACAISNLDTAPIRPCK